MKYVAEIYEGDLFLETCLVSKKTQRRIAKAKYELAKLRI